MTNRVMVTGLSDRRLASASTMAPLTATLAAVCHPCPMDSLKGSRANLTATLRTSPVTAHNAAHMSVLEACMVLRQCPKIICSQPWKKEWLQITVTSLREIQPGIPGPAGPSRGEGPCSGPSRESVLTARQESFPLRRSGERPRPGQPARG
ncbi:hypothetical protein [Frog virus 3]